MHTRSFKPISSHTKGSRSWDSRLALATVLTILTRFFHRMTRDHDLHEKQETPTPNASNCVVQRRLDILSSSWHTIRIAETTRETRFLSSKTCTCATWKTWWVWIRISANHIVTPPPLQDSNQPQGDGDSPRLFALMHSDYHSPPTHPWRFFVFQQYSSARNLGIMIDLFWLLLPTLQSIFHVQ